jgi:hypothetical protein
MVLAVPPVEVVLGLSPTVKVQLPVQAIAMAMGEYIKLMNSACSMKGANED